MRRWNWAMPLLLASCATLRPTSGHEVSLMVYPRLDSSTQAIVNPYTLSSIATLDIVPYVEVTTNNYSPISSITGNPTTVGAADELKLTQGSPIEPTRPFMLRGLKPNKKYRMMGKAYNTSNALISLDASSFVDVAVVNDDAPNIAQLPIHLTNTTFAATAMVSVLTEGRFDFLKGTLYLVSGNTQVALIQSVRSNPDLNFTNLQGNTSYRLVVEAYKLGGVIASNSLNFDISNDTSPATMSLALNVPYVVTTFAGNGTGNYADGQGTSALINWPCRVAVDSVGNVYVADRNNYRVRKITPGGMVSTLAGSGVSGLADGTGTAASFSSFEGIDVDLQGNVYVADGNNAAIRKIDPNGVTTTLAGNGTGGFLDGTGSAAYFNAPHALTVDSQGIVYVADRGNNRIRKVTQGGVVTTIAGNGAAPLVNGQGTAAQIDRPWGITIDAMGNLFVADYGNNCVRKITSGGMVSTYAGVPGDQGFLEGSSTTAVFSKPVDVDVDSFGNVYVADFHNYRVRKVSPSGIVSTLAGSGNITSVDGTGTNAKFSGPHGVAVDGMGNLYVADREGHRIRKMQ